MNFFQSLAIVGKSKYATFRGRATRPEFWWWYLFLIITQAIIATTTYTSGNSTLSSVITAIIVLGLFIPTLAVGVRRLHDTNRSGWNLLWQLIPVIGLIIVLVFMAQPGTPGDNSYGSQP